MPSIEAGKKLHVELDISPPLGVDSSEVQPDKIQAALNEYFQQHPQVIAHIFEIVTHSVSAQSVTGQLPRINKEQRTAILSSLREDSVLDSADDTDSEKWIETIKSARQNKKYSHNFFDET